MKFEINLHNFTIKIDDIIKKFPLKEFETIWLEFITGMLHEGKECFVPFLAILLILKPQKLPHSDWVNIPNWRFVGKKWIKV